MINSTDMSMERHIWPKFGDVLSTLHSFKK
jgi:hypothetical protein